MCLVSFRPYFRAGTEYCIQMEFYFGKIRFGGLRISENFEALPVIEASAGQVISSAGQVVGWAHVRHGYRNC